MVGSGLGVSFLPGTSAVEAGLADAAAVTVPALLAADHPSRQIVVAWRAGSSRAAEGRLLAEVPQGAGGPSPRARWFQRGIAWCRILL